MTLFEVLEQERAKFGELITAADALDILNRTAWRMRPHWGLLLAPRGGNGAAHPNGFVRLDILVDGSSGTHYDVFIDGPDATQNTPGRAKPAFQDKGPIDLARFVAPINPGGNGAEPPPPRPVEPPPPPADEIDLLRDLLEPLEKILYNLESIAGSHAQIAADLSKITGEGLKCVIKLTR